MLRWTEKVRQNSGNAYECLRLPGNGCGMKCGCAILIGEEMRDGDV